LSSFAAGGGSAVVFAVAVAVALAFAIVFALAFLSVIPEGNLLLDSTQPQPAGAHPSRHFEMGAKASPHPAKTPFSNCQWPNAMAKHGRTWNGS
jgi:hypothetical protein